MENWMQILAPFIGIVLAALSASLSYIYTKRNQLRADECRLKEKYYLDYIEALSYNVISDDFEESKNKLSDAHNHILLIGSSDVVAKLRHFHMLLNKDYTQKEHDKALTELVKSMRIDLYKKSETNKDYPEICLSGNHNRFKNLIS